MSSSNSVLIEFISIKDGNISIEFSKHSDLKDLEITANGMNISIADNPNGSPEFIAEAPVDLAINKNTVIKCLSRSRQVRLSYGKFTGISNRFISSYNVAGNFIVYRPSRDELCVKKYNPLTHTLKELRYILALLISGKKASFYRLIYWLARPFFTSKKIWMFSDRPYTTGDNAEYLFKYVSQQDSLPKGILPIFAVNKNNEAFKLLKEHGRVVPFGGVRYTIFSLLADKRISSHFDEYIINPLGGGELCYDLNRSKYIYLEHGVLTSDSSDYFGRTVRNASLITAASDIEKEAIINNKNYGYSKEQVVTTGHARFDGLKSAPSRIIAFMPSWRESIAGSSDNSRSITKKGFRGYSRDFTSTEYFVFYNQVLSNPKLLNKLERSNCFVEFYIHPSFAAQWKDFKSTSRVSIMQPPHDYTQALSRGALLVTDYSGVAFDFAYMKKPVIYSQFDRDTLYDSHYYKKGYFSFGKQGFGPITYTVDDTVNEIIRYINSDFKVEDKYSKRAEHFFYKIDSQNSKRIYKQLLSD